jgi:hypothetical protein
MSKPENQTLSPDLQDHFTEIVLQKFKEAKKQENKDRRQKKKERERKGGQARGRDRSARPLPRDTQNPHNNQSQNLERKIFTEEEKLRKQTIEGTAGNWLDANRKDQTDHTQILKDTKLNLFAMTPENYTEIKLDLIKIQKKVEHDDATLGQFMTAIVDRAWTQPKFTHLYANLCQELASSSKPFKLKVVQTVSNEYYNAFSEFYDLVTKLELPDKPHAYVEEKFEKYLKRKNKLLGNIALIAELYKKKFLPHKIIRYICCN